MKRRSKSSLQPELELSTRSLCPSVKCAVDCTLWGLNLISAIINVNVLDPENDVGAKTIALHENLKRKDLSDPENRRLIAELDGLLRKKHGEAKHGGDRKSEDFENQVTDHVTWSTEKTAKKLGIGKTTVSEAKRAEAFVKLRPDLRHTKTRTIFPNGSPCRCGNYYQHLQINQFCQQSFVKTIVRIPHEAFYLIGVR